MGTLDPRIKSQVKKDDSNEVSAAIEESNSKTKVIQEDQSNDQSEIKSYANQDLFRNTSETIKNSSNLNVFNKDHTSTSSGQFSLLSAFGQSKPEVPENTGNVSLSVDENQASATESFALKLK